MLKLTLLGAVSASSVDANEVRRSLPPGKPLALLAYLACTSGHSGSRGRLVDLLWADVDADSGKHALRQTLWYIRRRLGEECLFTENDSLKLAAGFLCDRSSFLEAIEAGDLERAVTLYSGDFFPGFAAPGGAEFERWADIERAHVRGLFVRAGEDVARSWMVHGNARPAVGLARRVRDADPDNEATWRLLLEALLGASDRLGATSEADALERRLAADEREAEIPTRLAIRAVRHADHSAAVRTDTRTALAAELVGREREFGAITLAWERVRVGAAEHLHITAPAGLGKTRLITDIEARLRASRARVVRLRAAPGERSMPYALAAELASALARLRGAAGVSAGAASALVALNPAVSTWLTAAPDSATGDDVLRRRTFAMHELLQAVAAETPLALLIDDLHWSDEMSRQLLVGLASRIGNTSTLLMTASRPPSPFPMDGNAMQLISLAPFDTGQVGAMMSSIAEFPSEEWAERLPGELLGATGGSPLLVLEMLQFALDQGRLRITDSEWRCDDSAALYTALRPGRAVERRVAELDAAARQVLVVLALAGVPVATAIVSDAVDRTEAECEATLARLEHLGLAARDGNSWLPQHDEIASAALAAADEDTQRRSQRGLATAFSRGPAIELASMRRALSHALASGDDTLQSRIARDYVAMARGRGETRAARAVVESALGVDVSPALVRGLVASLPYSERVAWKRPARVLFSLLAVMASALWLFQVLRTNAPVINNTLLLSVVDGADSSAFEVELDDKLLRMPGPIDVTTAHRAAGTLLRALTLDEPTERPGRTGWAGYRSFTDSGVTNLDLVVADPSGNEKRIARNPQDDVGPAWSPDGRWITFLTRRRDLKDYATDVALVNVERDSVALLTQTKSAEGRSRFSPDGTRIAYVRELESTDSVLLCLTQLDHVRESCRPINAQFISARLYFLQENALLLTTAVDSAGQEQSLRRYDLERQEMTLVDSGARSYDISPDGAYAVAFRRDAASGAMLPYLYSLNNPSERRLLRTTRGEIRKILWRAPRQPRPSLDTVRVDRQRSRLPTMYASKIVYAALDAAGHTLEIPEPQWRSLDTAIAAVDEHGHVTGRQEGRARLVVSAGGYRADTASFTFVHWPTENIMDERWTGDVERNWYPFGEITPVKVAAAGGDSALLLTGDTDNNSGVFSKLRVNAAEGAGVEVSAKLKVSELKWQMFWLMLMALPDTAIVNAWKPRSPDLPATWSQNSITRTCLIGFPSSEGRPGLNTVTMQAVQDVATTKEPAGLSDGSWHRLRLQLFPDGRCGAAIDGVPMWISKSPLERDRPLSVMVAGRSVKTSALLGRTRVWTGIAPDVDWKSFDDTHKEGTAVARGSKH